MANLSLSLRHSHQVPLHFFLPRAFLVAGPDPYI